MNSGNDPPLLSPTSQSSGLPSSSSSSSSSPAPAFSRPSFSSAPGLEPLPPSSPSSSQLVQSKRHPAFRQKSVFSAPPLSSSPPSLNFQRFPALMPFAPSSAEAEHKIAASGDLSGLAASPSASPVGMGPPASHGCLCPAGAGLPVSSSSPHLPPGPRATLSPAVATAAGEDTVVPRPLEALQSVPIPPFLSKTYELVDDASLDPIVSWAPGGESFVVWDPVEFSRAILPRHFKHNNFSSFVRQLNTYGFHKIDTDRWEFSNEDFLQGQKHLLQNIHRRRSSQVQSIGSYLGSTMESARSGLKGELVNLRKDKNLLMQDVVKMQKEHLTMIQRMDKMKPRMHLAEQRQKQMVSFLAKVLQNPPFLEHLRQQQKRDIAFTTVKRKFLRQPKANQSELGSPCEGQIVKYERTQDGVISSSMNLVQKTSAPEQLENFLLGEMEDKFELDVTSQEFFGTSDETGERIPAFMDPSDASFKGKSIMSSPMDTPTAAAEYFVPFSDDISQERTFLDAISHEIEGISLPEETWNMNVTTGASLVNPGGDVWNNLLNEDAQELDFEAGSSASWNMGLQQGELEIEKVVGDDLSF